MVCTLHDQLSCCVSVYCVIHLILNRDIKPFGCSSRLVIINCGGVKIRDLLIKLPLTGPDFTAPLQLLVKILIRQKSAHLQSLIIHDPTLDGVLLRNIVDPLTKLDSPLRIDLKANCDDHLQPIVFCDVTLAIRSSYPKISDN